MPERNENGKDQIQNAQVTKKWKKIHIFKMQLIFTKLLHNFIIYILRVDIMDPIQNNWDYIVSSLGQLNE